MADGNISFGASDLFGVAAAAKWIEQTMATRKTRQYAAVLKANGDNSCESSAFNTRSDYTGEYSYCGTAIKTDTGTVATAFGFNTYVLDSASITWTNTDLPSMSIAGHQHDDGNAHITTDVAKYDWSGALPATGGGGVGIPTLGTNYTVTMANDSKVTSLTLTFTVEHIDVLDSTGGNLAGDSRNGRLELAVSGIGLLADVTLGSNWVDDDDDSGDSNTDADTWAKTAHVFIART